MEVIAELEHELAAMHQEVKQLRSKAGLLGGGGGADGEEGEEEGGQVRRDGGKEGNEWRGGRGTRRGEEEQGGEIGGEGITWRGGRQSFPLAWVFLPCPFCPPCLSPVLS